LNFPTDENVIVGLDHADDAGVYRINDEIALIQTVDFFTPMVDDPYSFGQIAAANALSDVYAMGGIPKTAMNLVAFPLKHMEMDVLRNIIKGGLNKMTEAGVVLVGGHSVEDNELKYGLSVTGVINPDRVLTKRNLQEGDRLVLTKPLGTGIISTAVKGGLASPQSIDTATRMMAALNRGPAEAMSKFPVHACTDVTGFGLLGHLCEMIEDSRLGVTIESAAVPLIEETIDYAAMGLAPAGAYNNRSFRESYCIFDPSVDEILRDVLFDPQTSGGLLIAVDESHVAALVAEILNSGQACSRTAVIGRVVASHPGKIRIH
jgi:selenide, water dikinase